MRLCIALCPFKRALIIVGGYGLKWNLSPSEAEKWDYCVSQMIGIANYVGVMASSGRKYYELMDSAPGLVHLAQEQAAIDVMVRMLLDGINAMYGAKPAGSFATMQRLDDVGDSTGQPGNADAFGTSGSDATGQLGLLTDAEQEAEDARTWAEARPPRASSEEYAAYGSFLKHKAELDRPLTMWGNLGQLVRHMAARLPRR